MPNTLPSRGQPTAHELHCVCSFACWWREMLELEVAMEYRRSSPEARAIWDGLLGMQIPNPNRGIDAELRACVLLWSEREESGYRMCGTLLDVLVAVATHARLELPRYTMLAAFRLRRMLTENTLPGDVMVKQKAAG